MSGISITPPRGKRGEASNRPGAALASAAGMAGATPGPPTLVGLLGRGGGQWEAGTAGPRGTRSPRPGEPRSPRGRPRAGRRGLWRTTLPSMHRTPRRRHRGPMGEKSLTPRCPGKPPFLSRSVGAGPAADGEGWRRMVARPERASLPYLQVLPPWLRAGLHWRVTSARRGAGPRRRGEASGRWAESVTGEGVVGWDRRGHRTCRSSSGRGRPVPAGGSRRMRNAALFFRRPRPTRLGRTDVSPPGGGRGAVHAGKPPPKMAAGLKSCWWC